MKFNEYYKQYLTLHTTKECRIAHVMGNLTTLYLITCLVMGWVNIWWVLLVPFIVYPFAWLGHWYEGNKPAAWSNPIYAKLSDWRMMFDLIRRKI